MEKEQSRYIVTSVGNVLVRRIPQYEDILTEIIRFVQGGKSVDVIMFGKQGERADYPHYSLIDYDRIPLADLALLLIDTGQGYVFWENHTDTLRIFVVYDDNGLIEDYRFDVDAKSQSQEEASLSYKQLVSSRVINNIDEADICGSFVYPRFHQHGTQDYTLSELQALSGALEKE